MDPFVPQKVQEAIFNQILDRPENKVCADCPNKSPSWASIDFGVFICLRCSGAHRRLSPVVTRVRSAKIDDWKMDHIEMVAAVGNKIGNDYWESNLPSYFKKPDISTSLEDVFEIVKNKYVKALYAPKDRINPVKEFLEAKKDGITTAGTFNQAKMGQKKNAPEVTITKIPQINEKKVNPKAQDLLNFDDDGDFGEFKSAPEKSTRLDIPKPDFEVKFISNNGVKQKSQIDLLDTNVESKNINGIQKTKSFDPFSFDQSVQAPLNLNNQKSNSTPSDSNKLYDLYKSGNQIPQTQNTTNVNGVNYSGGQSNYAYLDMLGGQQQNRFAQQQPNFGGFQAGANIQGNNIQNSGGIQNKTFGGFASQPVGGLGSNGFGMNSNGLGTTYNGSFTTNNNNGGFGTNNGGFGTSNGGFGTNNGGFSTNNNGFGTNSNGFGQNNSGLNSFGSNGFSSGSTGSKPTFGMQQQPMQQQQPLQQQPFTFNQSTPSMTTTTTNTSTFSFNTAGTSQNYNQPTNVTTGFSFL